MARPRTFSRRARDGTAAAAALGFLAPGFPGRRRAEENRESSIKAPFGFMQDKRPALRDVYRTLNKASTAHVVLTSCESTPRGPAAPAMRDSRAVAGYH